MVNDLVIRVVNEVSSRMVHWLLVVWVTVFLRFAAVGMPLLTLVGTSILNIVMLLLGIVLSLEMVLPLDMVLHLEMTILSVVHRHSFLLVMMILSVVHRHSFLLVMMIFSVVHRHSFLLVMMILRVVQRHSFDLVIVVLVVMRIGLAHIFWVRVIICALCRNVFVFRPRHGEVKGLVRLLILIMVRVVLVSMRVL